MSAIHRMFAVALFVWPALSSAAESPPQEFRVAVFSTEITVPLGHRLMGVLPVKAERIDDPLEAHGFVLLGPDRPIVLAALDWCELRNGGYDDWREALAKAAGTDRERVLVCCLHQHDAPVVDTDAQALLDGVGLPKELCDVAFHEACLRRVADALRESLKTPRCVTHLGLGQAKVEQVASNRRVVLPDGRVTFDRGSASGGDATLAKASEGEIDAFLKTLSLWDGETPVVAIHSYAVHPMSYYGKGGVSADFVGLARRRRQADDPQVAQISLNGCAGDLTAGRYNDGSPAMRAVLAERLHTAMDDAWKSTRRLPLENVDFRASSVELPFHEQKDFSREALTATLKDADSPARERILAAMGLASLDRVERRQPIELPCVDFGAAQLLLLPAESFVGYQLFAQQVKSGSFVLCAGYGECWPGYIPTRAAFDDGFDHGWRWCGPESPERLEAAIRQVLQADR